jgi:hypothetical protein
MSAAAALLYRLLWVIGLGTRLPETPRVVPHNLMDLAILLLLISLASNAEVFVRHEGSRNAATDKAA